MLAFFLQVILFAKKQTWKSIIHKRIEYKLYEVHLTFISTFLNINTPMELKAIELDVF